MTEAIYFISMTHIDVTDHATLSYPLSAHDTSIDITDNCCITMLR